MHASKAGIVSYPSVSGVNKSQVHSESFTCLDVPSAWLPPPPLFWSALAFPAEILLLGMASHLQVTPEPGSSVLSRSAHSTPGSALHSSSGHN